MTKKIYLLLATIFTCWASVTAQESEVGLIFRNGSVKGDSIYHFDNKSFSFDVNFDFGPGDTLLLELIQYRGQGRQHAVTYTLTSSQQMLKPFFNKSVKAGDGLLLTIRIRKRKLLTKDLKIASTSASTSKPYYFDVYFIHNRDTVPANQYILATRMKMQKFKAFKRLFFNQQKEVTRNFSILYKKEELFFYVGPGLIYHGTITVTLLDVPKIVDGISYNQMLNVSDLDQDYGLFTVMSNH